MAKTTRPLPIPATDAIVRIDLLGRPMFRSRCLSCGTGGLCTQPIRFNCSECYWQQLLEDAPKAGYWVYRLWRLYPRRLLYVGVTRNPRQRLRAHWRNWWQFIEDVTWEECSDSADMLHRESVAIWTEHPALNVDYPDMVG